MRGLLSLLALWLGACGTASNGPNPDALTIYIDSEAASVHAVVTAAGKREVFDCPNANIETSIARCTPGGIEVHAFPAEVVIRAPLHQHFYERVFQSGVKHVELLPVESREGGEDFVSSYRDDHGAQFRAFSDRSDSELGEGFAQKFVVIDYPDAPKIYFINGKKHQLHADFAESVLGIQRHHYNEMAYWKYDKEAVGGTLVWYPNQTPSLQVANDQSLDGLFTLNFYPSDRIRGEDILHVQQLVQDALGLASNALKNRLVFLPGSEAHEMEMDPVMRLRFDVYDAYHTTWRELLRGGEQRLNRGVSFGTLRRISPEELKRTLVSRRDILWLSRLPNELPLVAGTITDEPQTPLAHVNLAARARNTPNLALLRDDIRVRVEPFVDKLVRFEVSADDWTIREASRDEAETFWNARRPPRFVATSDETRRDIVDFQDFGFADANAYGVKAANLAELSHLLPEKTPNGFGIPFAYYLDFMQTKVDDMLCLEAHEDCLDESRAAEVCKLAEQMCHASANVDETLANLLDRILDSEEVAERIDVRDAALNTLRYLMNHSSVDAEFGAALDQKISMVFGAKKVRLRSSTNAEDLATVSGAGLYESKSAYASGNKRASLRIRKVWSSLWSLRAFEERDYWNIDHRSVRMGVLVNTSFPDEVANGVALTSDIRGRSGGGYYVNVQAGEVSVTNPENGAIAEAFTIVPGHQVNQHRYSSLSPNESILINNEIRILEDSLVKIARHFNDLYEDPDFSFEIEFKFHGPSRDFFIKQVRPYVIGDRHNR